MKTIGGIITLGGMAVAALGIVFMAYQGLAWLIEQAATHTWVWGAVAVLLGFIVYLIGGAIYWTAQRMEENRRG